MNLLGMADPGVLSADGLSELVFGIIRILAYGALGVVIAGIILTVWCDLIECGKVKRRRGHADPRRV